MQLAGLSATDQSPAETVILPTEAGISPTETLILPDVATPPALEVAPATPSIAVVPTLDLDQARETLTAKKLPAPSAERDLSSWWSDSPRRPTATGQRQGSQ